MLKRFIFVRQIDNQYCYIDKYIEKEVSFPYPVETIDDYNNYLLLVY